MRKLFRNKEANVKLYGITALVIIIAILVTVFIVMAYETEDDKVWPDPIDDDDPSLGDFGQELILEYADGTLQSVKPIYLGKILAVWHDDKEVSAVHYKLKAKASGSGQSTITIDPTNYRVYCYTYNNPANIKNEYILGSSYDNKDISVDDNWHDIVTWTAEINSLIPSSLANGIWYVKFVPDGSLRYKTDSWKDGSLPDYILLGFAKTGSGGQIVVTFDAEANPKYK